MLLSKDNKDIFKAFIKKSEDKLLEHVPRLFEKEKAREILKRGRLSSEEALIIASKKDTPATILKLISGIPQFYNSYDIKAALATNPKTPLRISKGLLGFLLKKDLFRLIRTKDISYGLRKTSLDLLQKKLPEIPLGEKISISKSASRELLLILLYDENPVVLETALWNPRLTELDVIILMQKKTTKPEILQVIASHKKWITRYQIKLHLMKNLKTPFNVSSSLVKELLIQDLRGLAYNKEISNELRNEVLSVLESKMELLKGNL